MKRYLPKAQPPESWFDALGDLVLACAGAYPEDEAELLRQLYALVLHAPSPSLRAGVVQPDIALFEASVSIGAAASAALSMLGEDAGYMLSRSADGQCLASVFLPGHMEEATAGADTPALAIVGAVAKGLQDVMLLPADRSDTVGRPPARLN